VINLGVGISALIPNVIAEEGIDDLFTATAEAGIIGGIPCSGLEFGATYNPQAIIDQPYMFDFYDGGGLDVAFVSFAKVDRDGNGNVTKFGDRPNGCGGFIDITQNAESIVFGGTLTSRGSRSRSPTVGSPSREGEIMKFVPRVAQISYNGRRGRECGQDVTFVTERAVFRMTPESLVLTEIAPGARLKEDVLDRMEFEPAISPDLGSMDPRLFREGCMGLREDVLAKHAPRPARRTRP
jgi:propionate CoA-transferase